MNLCDKRCPEKKRSYTKSPIVIIPLVISYRWKKKKKILAAKRKEIIVSVVK